MYDINIPPDAIFNKSAPFNEVDYGDCLYCGGESDFQDVGGKVINCIHCDGTGRKTEEQVQDEYESYLEDMND